MDDAELSQIRSRRMAELQSRAAGGPGGQGQVQAQAQQQEENARQMEDMKNSILSQVLDQQARARLNTIAITKPEKARRVEAMLIQMAQTGQLSGKVDENELKSLLERLSEAAQQTSKVKFDRRRAALDDDDDDDFFS